MKEFLSQKGVNFAYFDISDDFGALKRFLKIRDDSPLYDPVREKGAVGLPTIIVDDEILIGLDRRKLEGML